MLWAQKFDNQLNFRELPVSLLRLYFSGQHYLRRAISRLSQSTLHTLFALFHPPLIPLPSDPAEAYQKKCLHLEASLTQVLDFSLCSFEQTLNHLLRLGLSHFPLMKLSELMSSESYWAALPCPQAPESACLLWLTVVWRMNVSLVVERLLKPWEDEKTGQWFIYQCQLFRDTHLDLLSRMVKYGLYEDEKVVNAQLLRDYYPMANRVCCAEELPDFIIYATDNFKTGSNLKERSSLDDKIGHIYVNKTGPNICKIRNFFDIIIRYGEEDAIIYDILKNVIKCVLLGNLPHSRGSLDIMARIKINLSFSSEEADVEISEEEFREVTKNKSLKRKRSKKKTKDELVYTKTRFKLWLLLCRHFVLFLLKEFFFYIAESSECFDKLLSVDYKFVQYREIVRIANGHCRNVLSSQAKVLPLMASFCWSVIEYEEKSTETYDTKGGKIKDFHAWALKVARKVQKDEFMKILAKKMTNTEESIALPAHYTPFYYVESAGEVASAEKTISLDDLHFICWYMSKNKTRVMETRWFQVIGMSENGLKTLRTWHFLYSTYDIPDNSFKKFIKEFQAENMKDYMILKTVLKLIEYYKQDQIVHLPLNYAKKQVYALRRLLGVEDWEKTPPLLGYAYQCVGCHKFANAIVEPLEQQTQSRQTSLAPVPALKKEKEKEKEAAVDPLSKKRGRKVKPRKTMSTQEKAVFNHANVTSCFLNSALYRMEDGKLYCPKYTSGYKHILLAPTGSEDGQMIMRKKDNSIVVYSNKTVLLHPQDRWQRANSAASQQQQQQATKLRPMSAKEREDKKTQWLMEIRAFEFNDTASSHNAANDVACGLFAPTAVNDESTSTTGVTALATTTTVISSNGVASTQTGGATKNQAAQKNNKKIILGYVQQAILDKGYTCNHELQRIDMVGIIKDRNALCVECGCMTVVKNHNITNHGITCGRHKSVYESDYESRFKSGDKRSAKYAAALAPDPKEGLLPDEIEAAASITGSGSLKHQLHPLDIVQKHALCTTHPNYIETELCVYCAHMPSKFRITAIGQHYKMLKVSLCRGCFDLSLSLTRNHLPTLLEVYQCLNDKKPLGL